MGFFDLNIPYHESDRHSTDKSSLRGRRLKLALKAMELGYTGIAYNRSFKGVMSESDRCSIPLFPLTKLTTSSSSSSFVASVKLHRELLNVAVSSPFRQYTRLTVTVDFPSQLSSLNDGNSILRSYDIVAVRPMNQNAFDQACQTSEVDIIAIDFSDKLPFRLKQHMVKAAIKRGVYFEIPYSGLIADAQSRRQLISNCKLLVDWTRGQNIILCSAAPSATELRGPQDVANLFSLLGLSSERAKAAISKNCRSLLANVLRKKNFHKEAVKVEAIPSGEQVNPVKSTFNDWLNWDPISSGEGDILLDDLEKSFSNPKTAKENVKSINFTSDMNGLPVHGLQIKDLICVTGAALGPPNTGNRSDDLESNLVASDETKLQDIPSNDPSGNTSHNGEGLHITKVNRLITSNHVSLDISDKFTSDASRLESTEENQCDIDVCADKGIAMDIVPDKIGIENIHVRPLASSDASSQGVHVEGKNSKMTDNSVKLGDDFPVEVYKNITTDSSEPIEDDVMGEQIQINEDTNSKAIGKSLAGRKKRKRNSLHQPLLVPFKHFPKPRHSKKNSRE